MGITPVSNNSNAAFLPQGDKNSAIKLLEKQKEQLQEQIKQVSESKLDDKTKQDRIKQLQDQIEEINTEIQQKQTEKLNQNKKPDQQTADSKANTYNAGESNGMAGMSSLLGASAAYSQTKIINGVKNDLIGKGNVLKIEIKLDEGRRGTTKGKKAELRKTELKEKEVEKKAGEKIKTSQKLVREAADSDSKEEDKDGRDGDGSGIQNSGENDTSAKYAASASNNNMGSSKRVDIRI